MKLPADVLEDWEKNAEDFTYFRIVLENMRHRNDLGFSLMVGAMSLMAFFINIWVGLFLFIGFVFMFARVAASTAKLELVRQEWLKEDSLREN